MSNQDITARVAKAVYEGRNGPGCKPWAHQTKEHQKPYLADAHASGKIWTEAAATIIDSYAVQLVPVRDRPSVPASYLP